MRIFQGITATHVVVWAALMALSPAWLAAAASVENPALIWACYVLTLVFFAIAWVALFWARVTSWAGGRPEFERMRGPATPRRIAPVAEDLKQRCCELSAELFEFYKQWWYDKDEALQAGGLIVRAQYEIDGDPDRSLEAARHDSWLMKQYSEQFGDKVLELSDELAQHGCIAPETRKRLESPEKPQDVQYIAQRLKVICGESDES